MAYRIDPSVLPVYMESELVYEKPDAARMRSMLFTLKEHNLKGPRVDNVRKLIAARMAKLEKRGKRPLPPRHKSGPKKGQFKKRGRRR